MFKVLCIDNDFFPTEKVADLLEREITRLNPVVGKEYTVVDEDNDGFLAYELAEIPPTDGHRWLWDANAFVRIDGPDETKMMEGRQREMAERLDRIRENIERQINETEPT